MSLKVIHQGNENLVEDGSTALIGSDASASIRIVRPGISRKHAIVSHDGGAWKVEDAGSRNGTFKDGKRVQTLEISGPTTLYLGHPTDGEPISLVPVAAERTEAPVADEAFALTEPAPLTPPPRTAPEPRRRSAEPTRVQQPAATVAPSQAGVAEHPGNPPDQCLQFRVGEAHTTGIDNRFPLRPAAQPLQDQVKIGTALV